jgi:hypothetical protein
MQTEETSTVAAALTVKPAVDPKVVIAVAGTLVVAAGVVAAVRFKRARDAKKAATIEIDEN